MLVCLHEEEGVSTSALLDILVVATIRVTPQPMAESSGRGTERNRLFRSFHNNYHTIQLYNTSHTVSQIITSYHRNQLNNMGTVPTTHVFNYYRPNLNIVLRLLDG